MSRTINSPRHEALRALLVRERKAAGLTQADVAERLGRYQSFVATIEKGQRRVDVIEFLDLAKAIGFSAESAIAELARLKPGKADNYT
jgi:transcriptional regulator with XRE-family HTH domain